MAKREAYIPPPDPDFEKLAHEGRAAYMRDQPRLVAFDTETTGLAYFDTPFCVTFAWRNDTGIEAHYIELEKFDGGWVASTILENAAVLVGHNIKFDFQKCLLAGVVKGLPEQGTQWFHDTETMAHLLDEHRPKGLKPLAVSVLGEEDLVEVVTQSGPNKGAIRMVPREKHELDTVRRRMKLTKADGFHKLPRSVILPYALKDAIFTLSLYEKFLPLIRPHEDLCRVYQQEKKLTLMLMEMERQGLALDLKYLSKHLKLYQNRVTKHEIAMQGILGRVIGPDVKAGEFNPASAPQIKEFFTSAGFVTEDGSYDGDALKGISHPLAAVLLDYRSDAKILSTYFRAMAHEQRDGVLHPSYRQNVSTGRMASGKERG